MLIEKLKELIECHTTLTCGAIIYSNGEVKYRAGDFTEFEQSGLASSVLGPYGSPSGSYQLAAQYEGDRKMLPQRMGQGNLFALIDKPSNNYVVVVFGKQLPDFLEQHKLCKKIGENILKIFNENVTA